MSEKKAGMVTIVERSLPPMTWQALGGQPGQDSMQVPMTQQEMIELSQQLLPGNYLDDGQGIVFAGGHYFPQMTPEVRAFGLGQGVAEQDMPVDMFSATKMASTYELEGDVQGVGVRKTLHSLMDAADVPGVAYNDAMTRKVMATIGGEDEDATRILEDLRAYLEENPESSGEFSYTLAAEEPLYDFRMTPEELSEGYLRQGFTTLGSRDFDEQAEWARKRFRLGREDGELVGQLPQHAIDQLQGYKPIYWQQIEAAHEFGPQWWQQQEQVKLGYEKPKKKVSLLDTIAAAAKKTKQPKSKAQAEAGNYPKGKFNMHGMRFAIENPKGSVRKGTDDDGRRWSIRLNHHYGYIQGTEDSDSDPVDVFCGGSPDTELVFVIDQCNPKDGSFDEHKVMFGFKTKAEAKKAYLSNYEKGWKGCGEITPLTMDQFKTWLNEGDQKKPMADQVFTMTKKEEDTAHPVMVIRRHRVIRMVVPSRRSPENTIKESAEKSFVKQADVRHLLHAIADPAVRNWMEEGGYVWPGFDAAGRNPMHALEDQRYREELFKAMQGQNVPSYQRLIKGLYALGGREWTPGAEEQTRVLSENLGKVTPYLAALFGNEAVDAFAGVGGGTLGLTKAIADIGRHHGITPRDAARMANEVAETFHRNPDMRYGFSTGELARLMDEAMQRGLISPTDNAETMAREISEMAQPMAAIRDVMDQKGYRTSDAGQLFGAYDRMRPQYKGQAGEDMAAGIRAGQFFDRRGGMLPAALARAGVSPHIPNVRVRAIDQQLRQRAAGSEAGNMAAAGARLEDAFGFPENSPAAQWMADLRKGKMDYQTAADFIDMMHASGIDKDIAGSALNSTAANAPYLTPEMVATVRANQMQDFQPSIARIQQRYPGSTTKAKFMRQNELNEMAAYHGYEGEGSITPWKQMQMYHGRAARSVPDLMAQARREAELSEMASAYRQPTSWISRISGAVQSATPETKPMEFASKVMGMPNIKDLPGPVQQHLAATQRPLNKTAVVKEVDAPSAGLICALTVTHDLEKQAKHTPTVAVDLDGTIAKPYTKFDINKIEAPRPGVADALQKFKDKGWRVIIFTVRGDRQQIEDYLTEYEIPYDYINENPDQPPGASGKVLADIYIDDRAVDARQNWADIAKKVVRRLGRTKAAAMDYDSQGRSDHRRECVAVR